MIKHILLTISLSASVASFISPFCRFRTKVGPSEAGRSGGTSGSGEKPLASLAGAERTAKAAK